MMNIIERSIACLTTGDLSTKQPVFEWGGCIAGYEGKRGLR